MMMLDWSRRAACQTMDPELFFPITLEGPGREQVERAKEVCRGCPVRQPCLDYAIDTRQMNGVWGGTDPSQRRSLTPMVPLRPETVPVPPLPGDR
ncbi:WhiB family transcriptional regulator [Nonomuraea muscovyensis]|jgi:WhiB family redox-sensing transcriptional regulator|nr:WhiB family transcriptional regulator [Nonomuraea muscovyensis]MDF2704520.1 WhiB family transcriptional regulator [Nonomuraea muscovyensis]